MSSQINTRSVRCNSAVNIINGQLSRRAKAFGLFCQKGAFNFAVAKFTWTPKT
jgi:hypothetical protein